MTHFPTLKNVIVYRYIIIMGWEYGQGAPINEKHWNNIWQLTEEAWKWLHAQIRNSNNPPKKPVLEITRKDSQSIAAFNWKSSNEATLSISLESRLFSDSGFLQLNIWQNGEGIVDDFGRLQRQVQHIGSRKDDLSDIRKMLHIDEIFCWYAEVGENEPLLSLTQYFLEPYIKPEDRIDICNFSWGCVGIPRDQKTPLLILSHENAPGVEDTSWFVNSLVPRLALFSGKIIRQYYEYEAKQEEIRKIAQKLVDTLRGSEHGGDLYRLEKRIQEISDKVDKLVEELSWVKKRLIGMEDNLRQIRHILQDPIFERKSDLLWQIFGESNALLVDHVQTDFKYFQAHNEEALLTLQTLQAFVGVDQAKLQRERAGKERRVVKIFGVVGLGLALIDGFSDKLSSLARILIVSVAAVVAICLWLWDKRKEKKEFETKS